MSVLVVIAFAVSRYDRTPQHTEDYFGEDTRIVFVFLSCNGADCVHCGSHVAKSDRCTDRRAGRAADAAGTRPSRLATGHPSLFPENGNTSAVGLYSLKMNREDI